MIGSSLAAAAAEVADWEVAREAVAATAAMVVVVRAKGAVARAAVASVVRVAMEDSCLLI